MNNVATAMKSAIGMPRPIATHACQVIDLRPLSANTFQIELQSPVGTILDYQAGQYLQIDLDLKGDGQLHSLFYSIANGFDPENPRRIQLFIQKGSALAETILKHLMELSAKNTTVKVTLPMGQAYLQTDLGLTHLLIAAGSGISKIKCLAEEILRRQPDTEVKIYWSNKKIDEFYLLNEFKGWADQNNHLEFTPILESANDDWQGGSGYIYRVIEKDVDHLDGVQAYLCGSPQMVYGTMDKLKTIGLKTENCYSDVFEYAPRT